MGTEQKIKKGWHIAGNGPPRKGVGSATVEPIMKHKHIKAISTLLENNPRDLALFIVGINAGLRARDLLGLQWKDVLTPELRIRKVIKVLESKTKKTRKIALGPKPVKALLRLRDTWEEEDFDEEAYIFPSRKGGKLTMQRLHQLVNLWTAKCKIKGNYGTHTLRKTYGYFHYKKGVDIALLMDIFGHSSERVTLRYIGIKQKQIDEANVRLNLG